MMSDKTRFYRMTRPVKFRRLKLIFKSVGLTYEVGKERIKYLFNYLLYKLNILKRYSYRTNTEKVFPVKDIEFKSVQTDNFAGTVVMNLVLVSDINIDYFYREKNGSKVITYVMKDEEKFSLFSSTTLEDIAIKLGGGGFHLINQLPTIKMAILPHSVSYEYTMVSKPVEYETVTYDTRLLRHICNKKLLGLDMKPEDLSEPMLRYYYEYSFSEIESYLRNLPLSSLIKEEL